MPKLTGSLAKYPARVSFFWYLVVILAGSLALLHPACGGSREQPISWLDAIFTSTSAACVTGLAVRSTEHDFSLAGQLVILLLIQLGGIGIMTVTTYVMMRFGRHASLRERALVSETLGADSNTDLQWALRNVLLMTLVFEGCGFVLLAIREMFQRPLMSALWYALFHSVSAFCNAGFSLNDDSLMRYRDDPLVNATIMLLIITGGLGFPVVLDLKRNWSRRGLDFWDRLHLHSKLMLLGTAVLLLLGSGSFLLLEWDGVLSDMPLAARLQTAMFHSVTCRTAGFNTVDVSTLSNATLFISVLLMMIGAGPCSTAGGFKVSTISVLTLRAWMTFRGQVRVSVFRRTIPEKAVARATAVMTLFAVVAVLALTVLLVLEQSQSRQPSSQNLFLDAAFEVVSALGTVGLSTGLTTLLTDAGRVVIIILMFIGRLGPMSVFVALSQSEHEPSIEYPGEEPMLG